MSNPEPTFCPNCETALSAGLTTDKNARCPRCGLQLSGWLQPVNDQINIRVIEAGSESFWHNWLLPEQSTTLTRFQINCVGFILFAIWGLRLISSGYRDGAAMQSFLHLPLLVFHEAGHILFIPFGQFMTILGGTLGQLLMPLIIGIALLRQNRDALGASLALWLLGYSFIDCAPYIYDAIDPKLPLLGGHIGGDSHDWINLLSMTNLLSSAHGIARIVYLIGVFIMLTAGIWAGMLLYQQKKWLQENSTDS